MNTNAAQVEALRWQKFQILDDGFVCLVDVMGDDQSVVQAARVSYGAGTRKASDDRGLIRYLMRHRHSTPFEMAELKFLVRAPMDTWRQWIRHRTANVNEYSTRYSLAIDASQKTPPDKWRLQASQNNQGSDGYLAEWGPGMVGPQFPGHTMTPGQYLTNMESSFHEEAKKLYDKRIELGVAREQARKDLPLSTYTEAYWKVDLHNLLHFLALRMDGHAQEEIRTYATTIGEKIVKELFPLTWEAFEDYRLGAMTLTRLDVEMIKKLVQNKVDTSGFMAARPKEWQTERNRERDECFDKLTKLGFVPVPKEECDNRSGSDAIGGVGNV